MSRGVGSWERGLVAQCCRAAALIEEERVEGNEWMVDDKPAPNRRNGRSKRERCARPALQLDRGGKSGRRAVVVCGRLFAWQGGMYTGISCTGCGTSTGSQFMICP